MEAALLLYDWFRNNRVSLRDQTSESHIHPAAERCSYTPSLLDSRMEQEDRRDMVEFSDDRYRGRLSPLETSLWFASPRRLCVHANKAAFVWGEGEACKEEHAKSPPLQICTKTQDESIYIGSASAHYYTIVNHFSHLRDKSLSDSRYGCEDSFLVLVFYRCLK